MGEKASSTSDKQALEAIDIDALAAKQRVKEAVIYFLAGLIADAPEEGAPSTLFVDDETFGRLIGRSE